MLNLRITLAAITASLLLAHAAPRPAAAQMPAPIVIFTDGQSNFENNPAYTWTPNVYAKKWNGGREGVSGTAFAALDGTSITVPDRFASDIASLFPGRPVYLINIVQSGTAIEHWLPGTSAPDVYATATTEIPKALAAIGADHIDIYARWQGEANAYAGTPTSTFSSEFEQLITRYKTNSWFPPTTKVMIFSIPPTWVTGNTNSDLYNVMFQSLAQADPAHRVYVPTNLFPAQYWDSVNIGHLNASGYDLAGSLGARLAQDTGSAGWTPYIVTLSCFSGSLAPGASAKGSYMPGPGKVINYQIEISLMGQGSCAAPLKASLPLATSAKYFPNYSFDAFSGAAESAAIGGAADPNTVHIFSKDAGFPIGNPVVGGHYERQ